VVATTGDDGVRALGRRLLLTDFVTELRTALQSVSAAGVPLREEPAHVRAQLAVLLRESGLDAEARAEGKRALEELARLPEPPPDQDAARHWLRARARALEATGDGRAAADAYGRLVRWAGRSPQCGACHALQGPKDLAWFRDWWAGRRYARLAAGAGRLDAEIAASEEALRRDGQDVGARLALAYLLEARGGGADAAAQWTRLIGP
jgi:tetratricopeptide (TPR) repeat protein